MSTWGLVSHRNPRKRWPWFLLNHFHTATVWRVLVAKYGDGCIMMASVAGSIPDDTSTSSPVTSRKGPKKNTSSSCFEILNKLNKFVWVQSVLTEEVPRTLCQHAWIINYLSEVHPTLVLLWVFREKELLTLLFIWNVRKFPDSNGLFLSKRYWVQCCRKLEKLGNNYIYELRNRHISAIFV